jgi:hypothetical protein
LGYSVVGDNGRAIDAREASICRALRLSAGTRWTPAPGHRKRCLDMKLAGEANLLWNRGDYGKAYQLLQRFGRRLLTT